MYLRDGSAQTVFTCCHTEIKVADQTFYLTQSQYTDTGLTSPSADPITPGAWQGSDWSANFLSHWYDLTPKKSRRKRDSNPGSSALEADALTTRPTRRLLVAERPQNRASVYEGRLVSYSCLTPSPPVRLSQGEGRICTCTCRHTDMERADQTFSLTRPHHTDTGSTSSSADPVTPGAWQSSHRSANV